MSKQADKLSDAIRRAIATADVSRYRIAKDTGVSEPSLSKFMAGAWLGQDNIDALAAYLGLAIITRTKGR